MYTGNSVGFPFLLNLYSSFPFYFQYPKNIYKISNPNTHTLKGLVGWGGELEEIGKTCGLG